MDSLIYDSYRVQLVLPLLVDAVNTIIIQEALEHTGTTARFLDELLVEMS